MEFNEQLKKARKKAGLKQTELAKEAGISVNSLRLYEAGKITPNLDTLTHIAFVLRLHIRDLIDGTQYGDSNSSIPKESENLKTTSEAEIKLLQHFRKLNADGQSVAVDRVEELAQIPKYQRTQNAPQDPPTDADDKEPTPK